MHEEPCKWARRGLLKGSRTMIARGLARESHIGLGGSRSVDTLDCAEFLGLRWEIGWSYCWVALARPASLDCNGPAGPDLLG